MAKSNSSRFNIHKFITGLVVVLMVAGIGLTVYAGQQKTSTESEAAAGCSFKPKYTYKDSVDKDKSVVYNLRARNVNYTSCTKVIWYGLRTTNKPSKDWKFEYFINGKKYDKRQGSTLPERGDVDKIKLRVTPPTTAENRTYYFKTKACAMEYSRDGNHKISTNCNTQSLKYIKTKDTDYSSRPYNF